MSLSLPCCLLSCCCCWGCVLCSLTCDHKVKHGTSAWKKKQTVYGTAPVCFFFYPLMVADPWQCKMLWFIWSVSLTAVTHSLFPVSGCHISLLVKSPQTRRKPQRQLVNVEGKKKKKKTTSRFYSESSLETPIFFFISLWLLKVAQTNARLQIHSGVSVCLVQT